MWKGGIFLISNALYAGVGFFFNGRVHPNNSIVFLSDIGESSSALFCLTDRTRCCSITAGGERHGAWKFPNGSEIMQESMGGDIYRTRSYSSVILNRRNNAVGPTGIYTCEIPDALNKVLYIRVSEGSLFDILQNTLFTSDAFLYISRNKISNLKGSVQVLFFFPAEPLRIMPLPSYPY